LNSTSPENGKDRAIGRLEGRMEGFDKRFDKIDDKFERLFTKIDDLRSWKNRIIGVASAISVMAGIVASFFFDRISGGH